jgi:PIN domain nuclease of toxin-antitoxin system
VNLLPDTHALGWWLTDDSLLSQRGEAALDERSGTLVVPVMVLIELRYMAANKRLLSEFEALLDKLRAKPNVAFMDLTQDVAAHIDLRLDVHDAIIVATALQFQAATGEAVKVISKDRKIVASGLVDVIW